MTTYDLASGRTAAAPVGRLRSRLVARVCACSLLLAVAVPAFAQQAVPALVETGSIAAANPAAPPLSAPAISDEVQLPGHTSLFSNAVRQPIARAAATSQAPTGRIQSLIQHALALLGTPYRWGGTGTDGFDCSGLVGYVFRSALGIELPRVSTQMANSGELITDRANLSPGDLVFFGTHHGKRVDHVGIYVGDGRFLHAPRSGRDVTVYSLESGYWSDKYMEARRVAGI